MIACQEKGIALSWARDWMFTTKKTTQQRMRHTEYINSAITNKRQRKMTVYIFFHQFICLQNSKQGIENWLTDCICWAYYLRWREQRIRILTHLHIHTGAYSANQPDIELKERDDRGKKFEKKITHVDLMIARMDFDTKNIKNYKHGFYLYEKFENAKINANGKRLNVMEGRDEMREERKNTQRASNEWV